jgi:hypothetical protein
MGLYPQRCSVCTLDTPHSKQVRKDWGCDSEVDHELDRIPCHCDGSPACFRCDGTGSIPLRRCPNKIVTRATLSAIRYIALAKSGIWPVQGGSGDQAQSFLDAYAIVTSEIQRIEEQQHGQ